MCANYYLDTTNVDFAAEFRGKYDTAFGAYRLLSVAGGMDAILTNAGFVVIDKNYAHVGDVAIYVQPRHGRTMGIVTHKRKVVIAGGSVIPISECETIYRLIK